MMNAKDKKRIIDVYNERYEKHGYDPKALGWDKGRQTLRFEILLNYWNLKNQSLLDFGCGFGDLYGYLKGKNNGVQYTGVDLNKHLIEEGQKRYPQARLLVKDLLDEKPSEKFDVIIASGTHSSKISDNWGYVEKTFELFSKIANYGFALNFLSDRVDWEIEHSFHYDPVRMLKLAYKYSNRVVLRNDYMPFEFSVFVDLRKEFDPEWVVYPEFAQQAAKN